MMMLGLTGLRAGDNRRIGSAGAMGGWDQMRARIKGDGERPMLYVFNTCRDFIRTVPALQHDPDRAEDLDTEGEDHVGDETRYACMSRPYVAMRAAPPPPVTEASLYVRADGKVVYPEGWSIFNWAEAKRKQRESGELYGRHPCGFESGRTRGLWFDSPRFALEGDRGNRPMVALS
jgi:hypothetical protein